MLGQVVVVARSRWWPRYGPDHDLRFTIQPTGKNQHHLAKISTGLSGRVQSGRWQSYVSSKWKCPEFEVQEYLRTVWSYENVQIIRIRALWGSFWRTVRCFRIRAFQIFKIDFGVFFKCLTTKYLQNVFKYLRLTFSLILINNINMENIKTRAIYTCF